MLDSRPRGAPFQSTYLRISIRRVAHESLCRGAMGVRVQLFRTPSHGPVCLCISTERREMPGLVVPGPGPQASLLCFVDHFDRPDLCVIRFRREGDKQLPLPVGMQPMELADNGTEGCSGSLKDIEILEEHDAIAGHIENSTTSPMTVSGANRRAEKRLHEVKPESITPWSHWYSVAKVTVPLSRIKTGNAGCWLEIREGTARNEVVISAPATAVGIHEI